MIDPATILRNTIGTASQAQWAREHGISPGYVNDVLNGRREPGKAILEALGLERVVSYRKKRVE